MITDQEIRHAIAGIITAVTSGAKVYEWNVLSHDLASWPGLFDEPRHGWIIKRSAIESEWKQIIGKRERPTWTYDIWGFYDFRSGKEDDNSDDEFAVIVDAIGVALKNEPRLGLSDSEVEKHELLQVERITTIDCGEETLHLAQCRLKVHLCCE